MVHRSTLERSIVLKGKLGDFLAAFPADLQMYHHAGGTYRGRRGVISIPEELSGIITGIFGFDTRPKHRARYRQLDVGQGRLGKRKGALEIKPTMMVAS